MMIRSFSAVAVLSLFVPFISFAGDIVREFSFYGCYQPFDQAQSDTVMIPTGEEVVGMTVRGEAMKSYEFLWAYPGDPPLDPSHHVDFVQTSVLSAKLVLPGRNITLAQFQDTFQPEGHATGDQLRWNLLETVIDNGVSYTYPARKVRAVVSGEIGSQEVSATDRVRIDVGCLGSLTGSIVGMGSDIWERTTNKIKVILHTIIIPD